MKIGFMLCEKAKSLDEIPKGWIIQPKYDGTRIMAILEKGEVFLLNRKMVLKNDVFPEVVEELKKYTKEEIIFDGEIIIEDNFTMLAEREHLKDPDKILKLAKEHPATYMVFDIFTKYASLWLRQVILKEFLIDSPIIKRTKNIPWKAMKHCIDSKKYEGIVAKNPDSFYETKRSSNWLKFRETDTEDLECIGYRVSEKRGIRSLVCEKGTRLVSVGSGLTGGIIADLLNKKPIGTGKMNGSTGERFIKVEPFVVEVSYYNDNKGYDGYRFPVFKRIREDK